MAPLTCLPALGLAQGSSLNKIKSIQLTAILDHTCLHQGDSGWKSSFLTRPLFSEFNQNSKQLSRPPLLLFALKLSGCLASVSQRVWCLNLLHVLSAFRDPKGNNGQLCFPASLAFFLHMTSSNWQPLSFFCGHPSCCPPPPPGPWGLTVLKASC